MCRQSHDAIKSHGRTLASGSPCKTGQRARSAYGPCREPFCGNTTALSPVDTSIFRAWGCVRVALSVRDFEFRLPRWSMAENNLNITDFRLDRKLHYVQDLSITVERLGCPGYWRRIPSISGHKSVRTGSVSEGVVCQRSEPRKFDGSYAARRSRYDCHIPGDDNHG